MGAVLPSTVMGYLLTLPIQTEGKLEELPVLCVIETIPLSCHLQWTQHMLT